MVLPVSDIFIPQFYFLSLCFTTVYVLPLHQNLETAGRQNGRPLPILCASAAPAFNAPSALYLFHVIKNSLPGHQLVICTVLHALPRMNDRNFVRVPYGGQSVGDYKAGLAFHKLGKRALYLLLGTCINA